MTDIIAAVLAGGLGTRLRSVVADRPKVLAPVAGRPFLAHLLEQLASAGVPETVLLVGYGAEQVRAAFGEQFDGMKLRYSVEPEPRGTGGALRQALPSFNSNDVLLLNGDSYCELDLADFARVHCGRPSADVSMALARVANASRFGRVHVGADDLVTRFEEKAPIAEAGWINAGVYLVRREVIAQIPANVPVSLEREVLPGLVAKCVVRGFRGGRFIDIGVPDAFAQAEAFFGVECANAR